MATSQFFSVYGKNIVVNFADMFGDKFQVFSEFYTVIPSKRTYQKIAPFICKENNQFLTFAEDLADEFMFKYLTVKMEIDNNGLRGMTPKNAIVKMITSVIDEKITERIKEYVKKRNKQNVDKKIEKKIDTYDLSSTFLNRHHNTMYCISVISRLIIPLITHYVYRTPNIQNVNDVVLGAFMVAFKIAQANTDIDIYAKLHAFVYRAVQRTLYSDKVMWNRLKILGVTPQTALKDVLDKLITNVMPKYMFTSNIVNLNYVVIRKSIMSYTLRKKDPYTLYSLSDYENVSSDNDSMSTDMDVFEAYSTQKDESTIFFMKYSNKHNLDTIIRREGVEICDAEVDFYLKTCNFHSIQKNFVCSFMSKYYSGIEGILGGCTKRDWIILMLIVKKAVTKLNLNILSDVISAVKTGYSYHRMSRFIDVSITNNEKYKTLINTKYSSIVGIMNRKNNIRQMVTEIINNSYTYNSYGDPRNGSDLEKNELLIIDQILDFYNLMVM